QARCTPHIWKLAATTSNRERIWRTQNSSSNAIGHDGWSNLCEHVRREVDGEGQQAKERRSSFQSQNHRGRTCCDGGTLLGPDAGESGSDAGAGAVRDPGCCGTSSAGTAAARATGRTTIRGSAEEASRMAIGPSVRSLKRNTEAPFSARNPVA